MFHDMFLCFSPDFDGYTVHDMFHDMFVCESGLRYVFFNGLFVY
jgi:hypothetical protein